MPGRKGGGKVDRYIVARTARARNGADRIAGRSQELNVQAIAEGRGNVQLVDFCDVDVTPAGQVEAADQRILPGGCVGERVLDLIIEIECSGVRIDVDG